MDNVVIRNFRDTNIARGSEVDRYIMHIRKARIKPLQYVRETKVSGTEYVQVIHAMNI